MNDKPIKKKKKPRSVECMVRHDTKIPDTIEGGRIIRKLRPTKVTREEYKYLKEEAKTLIGK